jgi:hypothetical protein
MDSSFGNWLAGFIDGEGSFSTQIADGVVFPRFSIATRADDAPILETIQEKLGAGKLYRRPGRTSPGVYGDKPAVEFTFTNLSECLRLVEVLDEYPLRAKKLGDYIIWKEIVKEKAANGATNKDRLLSLRSALSANHAYQEEIA